MKLWNPLSPELSSNFDANLTLTIPSLFLYYLIVSYAGPRVGVTFDLSLAVSFVLIYIYASRFYQPDLDHRTNRPGKAHFPLGKTLSVFIMSNKNSLFHTVTILSWMQVILAKIWFWYWKPLTYFVTHRGATHIPIFGTIVRSLYTLLGIKLLIILHMAFSSEMEHIGRSTDFSAISWMCLSLAKIPFEKVLAPAYEYFKTMSLFYGVNKMFVAYCLPVYLADVVHMAVDLWDSVRRGKSYCPTPITDWGLIKRIFPRLPL